MQDIKLGVLANEKRWGSFEVAKLLIEKGADINARDKYNRTALMLAERAKKNDGSIPSMMAEWEEFSRKTFTLSLLSLWKFSEKGKRRERYNKMISFLKKHGAE